MNSSTRTLHTSDAVTSFKGCVTKKLVISHRITIMYLYPLLDLGMYLISMLTLAKAGYEIS